MTSISRERLYKEVWAEPMVTVAKRYDVSSNYLARICEQLNIPRPGRGYWQQKAVGHDVEPEPLPEPDPGDATIWQRGRTDYQGNPPPLPVFVGLGPRKTRRGTRPKTHPLLVGVREDFLDSRKRSFQDDGYLKPKRRALPDLFVSKDTLDRALDLANRLYLALEDAGHWVREAADFRYSRPVLEHRAGSDHRETYASRIWASARPTLVFIGGVAIGVVIFEIADYVEVTYEDGNWVRVHPGRATERSREQAAWRFHKQFMPNGRLGVVAYSAYGRGTWERRWEDVKAGDLKKTVGEMVSALELAAPEIATLTAEAVRKAEEEHRAYLAKQRVERREELAKMRAKAAAAESRDELLEIIESWVTACNIEQFFADLAKVTTLPEDKRALVEQRIQRARSLFGGKEALDHFQAWRSPEQFYAQAKKGLWWNADELE